MHFFGRVKRFWPPYIGIPPYSDRPIGGPLLVVDVAAAVDAVAVVVVLTLTRIIKSVVT